MTMAEGGGLVEVEFSHAYKPWPVDIRAGQGGYVIIFGWALKETTGLAAAELDLYDADPSGGGVLAIPITVAAGQSTSDWYGPHGVHLRNGYRPLLVSGAVAGSVFIDMPARGGRVDHRR